MLWYAAHTLEEVFGPALLFRIREAEWIVFSPNTTREVFLGRCGRLRSILQRRYPKQIRIGRAWADGVFTGRRLASEAKEAMPAHADWIDFLVDKYGTQLSEAKAVSAVRSEIGAKFEAVLEDAGVFKQTPEGLRAFERFLAKVGCRKAPAVPPVG